LNIVHGSLARIDSATTREPANGPDSHIVIADNLTAKTNSGQTTGREDAFLGNRHSFRFPGNEFNSASGAPCIASAGMQLVQFGFVG